MWFGQGDPLSPYLFILVSEILFKNISCAIDRRLLQGLSISRRGPTISHIFFPDDLLFFLKANDHNCQLLKNILDDYCYASGQSINHEKCTLFIGPNTPKAVKKEITTILHVPLSPNPGVYFCLPSTWGR